MTDAELRQILNGIAYGRMTLSRLAQKAGVSRETLYSIIHKRRSPLPETRAAIVAALQTAQREGFHIPRPVA
jgi:DNA-binding phage protein